MLELMYFQKILESFTPKYPLITYLYYPLFIGGSFWLMKGAIQGYKQQLIEEYTMILLLAVCIFLLYWVYLFTRDIFSTIDFYEKELVFTNVFGKILRVEKEEVQSISPGGIRLKKRILPMTFYFMSNNLELYIFLKEWKNKS